MSSAYTGLSKLNAKIAPNRQLTLADLLDPDLLIPHLNAHSKIGAIKELVDRLHLKGIVKDSLGFLQAVLERENLQSTILGGQVALPHARSRAVTRLALALGVAPRKLDYPSGDERQALRLICLIAVPAHAPGAYLALLSVLARTFRDPRLREALLQADSPAALHKILSSHPVTRG